VNDELLVLGEMDQDLGIGDREQELLRRVQNEINLAADHGDIDRAIKVCDYFQRAAKLSGKSLAHALSTMHTRWSDFGIGEEFIDYIYARIGLHRHTVERYIKVAVLLEQEVPEKYRHQIEGKGIQQLIPIANAMSQGYEIDNQTWEKLVGATNYAEVREVINTDVRRASPREGALSIQVTRAGSLLVYKGGQSPKFAGTLEVNDPSPEVQQAVERIIKNSGILRS